MTLPHCLKSIRTLADEIILLDTGSNDNTCKIALGHGAKVYHFTWANDFSLARNESLRHATGDWILYIDADETVNQKNASKIRQTITKNDIMAATVRQYIPQNSGNITTAFYSEYCRIFRNHPAIRFEGAIHEQILPSIKRLRGKILKTDIIIHHWAYALNPEKKRLRAERNLNYLITELRKFPDDPFIHFNLGKTYHELNNKDKAILEYKKVLKLNNEDMKLKYELLGQTHLNLSKLYLESNNNDKAAYHAQQIKNFDPSNPLFAYIMATIAVIEKKFKKAITYLETAINIANGQTGVLPSVELNMAQIYLELGSCRFSAGDYLGAESEFSRSLEYNTSQALPYLLLGNCRYLRSDYAGAKKMFQFALSIDPHIKGAKNGISLCSKV